jgi:hypothetical protein
MARLVWCCLVLFGLATTPAAAADLVLKRVMLSTGGVGYFEYEAQVDGNATLPLDVPLDQVDDVLKSLVVYDAGGSAGEITLPGREPLTQSFADLPFGRAALASEVDLLNALQGAEIRVGAPQAISGRLLHAERETVSGPGGVPETRTQVSVVTAAGLQQFGLQSVDAIAFADQKLQGQVETALERIAAYRAAGRRELTLRLHGAGSRTVRVGYVVAMPLWKATYRLSLPSDPKAAAARLQGWAVLENFSGIAWRGVELTLLSGNPVTFRQALYQSYYLLRPLVPVESGSRVLPPPDTGTVAADALEKRAQTGAAKSYALARRDTATMAMGAPMPAAAAPPPPAPIEATAAEEQATQIAFTAPDKVDVPAGQSLVLPLLDRALPARRVDLYQPPVDPRHPLAAVELSNDGRSGLPPGVVTLYQQDAGHGAVYLGDARLAALPAGDKRLLSYAVDGKVTVDRSVGEERPLLKATIAEGVMHLSRVVRWTTDYRIKAAGAAAPTLLIEQARRAGASLKAPDPKSVELTASAYRVPFALAAGEGRLAVVEEEPVTETVRLVDLDDNAVAAYVTSTELGLKLRQALAAIATQRQTVAQQRSALDRLREQRIQLIADETRLRNNLAVLGSDPALHKRMLDQFNTTETAIETLTTAVTKASDALAAAERELAAYVAGLTI